MYSSDSWAFRGSLVPDVWLRIRVTQRRIRFAALLSRITGLPLDRAWTAFRPLPAPDGPWGLPQAV